MYPSTITQVRRELEAFGLQTAFFEACGDNYYRYGTVDKCEHGNPMHENTSPEYCSCTSRYIKLLTAYRKVTSAASASEAVALIPEYCEDERFAHYWKAPSEAQHTEAVNWVATFVDRAWKYFAQAGNDTEEGRLYTNMFVKANVIQLEDTVRSKRAPHERKLIYDDGEVEIRAWQHAEPVKRPAKISVPVQGGAGGPRTLQVERVANIHGSTGSDSPTSPVDKVNCPKITPNIQISNLSNVCDLCGATDDHMIGGSFKCALQSCNGAGIHFSTHRMHVVCCAHFFSVADWRAKRLASFAARKKRCRPVQIVDLSSDTDSDVE